MDVKMAVWLCFAILAGIGYTVDADIQTCATIAKNCALALTDKLTYNAQNNLIAFEYTCRAVDDYKQCLNQDSSCTGLDAIFDEMLKTTGIDLDTMCGNTGGKPGGNNGGNTCGRTRLTTVFSISIIYILAMFAI